MKRKYCNVCEKKQKVGGKELLIIGITLYKVDKLECGHLVSLTLKGVNVR